MEHGRGVSIRAALAAVGLLLATVLAGAQAPPGAAAAAAPRAWRLVAVGDSIPYGGRYCDGCAPYPTLLGAALARQSGHAVTVTNLGIPGLTTAQLLANVRGRIDVRRALARADIVTITIGHNDTPWNSRHDSCDGVHAWFGAYRDARWMTYTGRCLSKEADALGTRLRAILATIPSLRGNHPTLVEVTTDWNQLIGEPGITATPRAASATVLDRFASTTCAAAKAYGSRCADVYHAFNGPTGSRSAGVFLAADHDHASQRGHQEIAALLSAFGFAPLPK